MKRSPFFDEIWTASTFYWEAAANTHKWKHERRYYRIRSAVRMAFWIPIVSFNIVAILGLVGSL